MSTQSLRYPARPRQRGTSLIEILVVLVILVVGILSIVRLFPAGFLALRNAENSTFANRLGTAALEQLKKSGNGLPDAIYMYVNNGFDPNSSPTDFTPYTANAAYNDVNKQRYISNETITVPATRMVSSTSFLPLYVLNYGPLSLPANFMSTSGDFLKVISMPWSAQTGDSRLNQNDQNVPQRSIDDPLDILQAGQQKFLVDYKAGAIAVPQAFYDQQFYVQVTLQNEGVQPPVLLTALATTPAPNTGYDGNWFSQGSTGQVNGAGTLPAASLNDPWVGVIVYRPFRCVADTSTSPTFTTDPYEFAVYTSNIATDVNPGVIAFNPLASGRNGTAPLKARISYMASDWHILHEDHDVSAGSPSVRLTLGHLKKIGDVQFDQTQYKGLTAGMTTAADILMLNLDTGAVTSLAAPQSGASGGNTFNDDDDSGNGSTTTPATGQYAVSYQNGRVTFPDGTPAQHLRFYYAGDADWALAVQKAASVYTLAPTATTLATAGANLPNHYFQDATDSSQVYFPICDSGKTVEFDGISYTDTNGKTQIVAEGTAQISITKVLVGGSNLVSVNLGTGGLNSSNVLPNVDTKKPVTFQAVRGISAQAVVIWHERNNWRSRTIDTLLTQTP